MSCNDVKTAISAYADGALPPDGEESMFVHLGTCADCRRFLGHVLDTRAAIAAMPRADVPESLDRTVLALKPGIAREKTQRSRWLADLWMRRLSIPLPSAAIVALALLSITIFSLSLLLKPNEVPLMSLPPVDVCAEHPGAPDHNE